MPWKAFLTDNKYCVFKLDSQDKKTGSSLGCHTTREEANRQVAALNVQETKESDIATVKLDMEIDTSPIDELKDKMDDTLDKATELSERLAPKEENNQEKAHLVGVDSITVPIGITSFTELDAMNEAQDIVDNMKEVTQQFAEMAENIFLDAEVDDKAEALQSLADEFATRVTQAQTNIQKEIDQESWLDKIVDKVKDTLGLKEKKQQSFFIWKEADGYKWLARYSNNIRDEEQEIIASESHQRFVKQVDEGLVPLPELWLWHIKEWKFGEATSVAYDDSGFAVATGTVDKNEAAESVAEWLAERKDILTSHGMPKRTVKRDEEDESIIIEHETREISPLFNIFAANKFTGFSILKEETDMAIPQKKKDEFVEQGLSAEVLDQLELQNAATDKETEELDKKEEVTNPEQSESVAEKENTPGVSRQEFVETLAEVVKPLLAQVKELTKQVEDLSKTDAEKVKEVLEDTPNASLKELTLASIFGTETLVDGRSSLAKSRPKEKEQNEEPALFFQDWLGSNAGTDVPNLFGEVE